MNFKDNTQKYGLITIAFHWVMAVIMISLLIIGFVMTNTTFNPLFYFLHKSFGTLVFGFAVLRIIWRLLNQTPQFAPTIKTPIKVLSKLGHFSLYAFMILMPLTGFLMSALSGRAINFFNLFVIPAFTTNSIWAGFFKEAHGMLAILLALTIIGHSLAALLHHYYFKDNSLEKMLPSRG